MPDWVKEECSTGPTGGASAGASFPFVSAPAYDCLATPRFEGGAPPSHGDTLARQLAQTSDGPACSRRALPTGGVNPVVVALQCKVSTLKSGRHNQDEVKYLRDKASPAPPSSVHILPRSHVVATHTLSFTQVERLSTENRAPPRRA